MRFIRSGSLALWSPASWLFPGIFSVISQSSCVTAIVGPEAEHLTAQQDIMSHGGLPRWQVLSFYCYYYNGSVSPWIAYCHSLITHLWTSFPFHFIYCSLKTTKIYLWKWLPLLSKAHGHKSRRLVVSICVVLLNAGVKHSSWSPREVSHCCLWKH